MQISVIGFPRIGTLRELKFASEKYFKKEIEAGELLQKAQELRKTHWLTQKNAGITYISSNDFSFYDMVLDTAALLGIVPKRYKELNLSKLDPCDLLFFTLLDQIFICIYNLIHIICCCLISCTSAKL